MKTVEYVLGSCKEANTNANRGHKYKSERALARLVHYEQVYRLKKGFI